MQFRDDTKMADLIHNNYLLLPILNRFNIQLGFGDKTVAELCTELNINCDFFLVIANSFHDHNYFPQEKLLEFPLSLLIDYIQKSHIYYLEIKVPHIESLIVTLSESGDQSQQKHMNLIEEFFSEYKKELISHIQDEEDEVFPYVRLLDKAYCSDTIGKEYQQLIRKQSINSYAEKHNNVEEKLFDLKNIIIKYMPPARNFTISNTLLIELFRLERDLNDHARIEDKVLIPKVQMIEQEILERLR